jgi:mRNA-degrading endonuclease YafQ of YafQ-DinJ toxin-antitoxin module
MITKKEQAMKLRPSTYSRQVTVVKKGSEECDCSEVTASLQEEWTAADYADHPLRQAWLGFQSQFWG